MNKPLISVIIPTYNEESRIARAINSMRNQTYPNLEIIVVDDGSTDQTATVVTKINHEDSRVRFYTLPHKPKRRTNWRGYDINAGFDARNYGFSLAKGKWITTQDADDASLLNRIETQYILAEKYQATLVTIGWQQLTPDLLDKQLDVDTILKQMGEKAIIKPDLIYNQARANRGILMIEPIHRFLPFPFKWFPYTRKLFYRRVDPYPGADNCMLFDRRVLDHGIYFRHRNSRTWGTPAGRGSGRDFVYRVAYLYKNSWSFKLPLYLWDVKSQNPEYADYGTYLH